MKNLFCLPVMILALGLAMTGGVTPAFAQSYPVGEPFPAPYTDLRGLIDRTQSDLHTAAGLEHTKKYQRERYQEAQGHLSTFDRKLVKGKFDKGELDKSINEIKHILDHNVLQASTRDELQKDRDELIVARDRHY